MAKQAPPEQPEAARLRQLADERRRELEQAGRERDLERQALDQKWREAREKLGPKAVLVAMIDLLQRARAAAERGETGLGVDLGVDEDRLRTTPRGRDLALAEAVLAQPPDPKKRWPYLDRVGWLLQSRDGQTPSDHGDALIAQLQEQGFSILFLPYFVQDNPSDPFSNARLEIQW
jgi:hypothetical protein